MGSQNQQSNQKLCKMTPAPHHTSAAFMSQACIASTNNQLIRNRGNMEVAMGHHLSEDKRRLRDQLRRNLNKIALKMQNRNSKMFEEPKNTFEAGDLSGFDMVDDFGWCEKRQEFGHFPKGHPLHDPKL